MRSIHDYASKGDKEKVIRLLETKTVPVDIRSKLFNRTPLHLATENGRVEVVKVLLNYHADIYAEDDSHFTPLFLAVCLAKCTQDREERQRSYQIVELLLRKEAELHAKMEYKDKIWLRDRMGGSSINKRGSGITPFEFIEGNKEIVARFLEIEAKIKQEYPNYLSGSASASENSAIKRSAPSVEVTKTLRQRKSGRVNREMTGDKSSEGRLALSRGNPMSEKDKPVSAPFYGTFFQKLSDYFSAAKPSKPGKNSEEQDPLISKPPHQ